jgi:hypothetical protein
MRWLALALALTACGRVGYDPAGGADAAVDAITEPPLACGVATRVLGLNQATPLVGLDVTETTTGFVAAWGHGGQVYAGAFAHLDVPSGPYLVNLQSGGVVGPAGPAMAIAAVGDDALLAVAHPDTIDLYPLNAYGYARGAATTITDHAAAGFGFAVADPARDRFVVLGHTPTEVAAFTRDRDGAPVAGPVTAFAVTSEGATAVATPTGYTLMTGASQCDFVAATPDLTMGARQSLSSTCHHAALVAAPGASERVIAGWNCDNDQVWANAGTLAAGWNPSDTSVYMTSAPPPEQPRLAVTPDGAWYGFRIGADRLAVALLDREAALAVGFAPRVVHTSPSLAAFDLVATGRHAYLFWLDAGDAGLWAMRLCPS